MPIKAHITDPATNKKAEVDYTEGEKQALVVATRPLKIYENSSEIFTDADGNADMNIGVAFGTPEGVYDGGDRTEWTTSTPVGGAGAFLETSTTHAKNAIITVTNNAAINGGDTITITTSATGVTVLTEGVEWNKLGNAILTIADIASAINTLTHMASASDGVDTANMYTTNAEDIQTIAFSGAGLSQSAQCIDATPSGNNDVLQFDRGSDLDLTGYVSLTGYIYITSWPSTGTKEVNLYGWDIGAGSQLGVSVNIGDYVNTAATGMWQKFTIPLTDMGIAGLSATFDGLRMATVDIATGSPPDYFIDYIQIEQAGVQDPTSYSIKPDKGQWLYVYSFMWSLADALDTTLANNSMPNLSYDKLLGVSELASGINYQRIQDGKVLFGASTKKIADMLQWAGAEIKTLIQDGTNVFLTIETKFIEPFVLKHEDLDEIRLTVNDDLSGLLWLRATCGCRTEERRS